MSEAFLIQWFAIILFGGAGVVAVSVYLHDRVRR